MKLQSALAIFALFWVMSFFIVLPFGVRTDEEAGIDHQPGHADSAPHRFSFGRTSLRATILSLLLFGLFYGNYIYGWLGIEALEWAQPPVR
jgi:predicted secreted protein